MRSAGPEGRCRPALRSFGATAFREPVLSLAGNILSSDRHDRSRPFRTAVRRTVALTTAAAAVWLAGCASTSPQAPAGTAADPSARAGGPVAAAGETRPPAAGASTADPAGAGTSATAQPGAGGAATAQAGAGEVSGAGSGTPRAAGSEPRSGGSAAAPGAPVVHATAPGTESATVVVQPAPAPAGSLWDRIRTGFAFPDLDTPLVAEKERFYLQRPDYLQRMFSRGSRYLYYIVEEVEKRGLPTELALLPFVESAMNPTALSSAQAAGLWQFIPSTGKSYNLSQNWWVDNRRDIVHSTQAALDYLQKIHAMQDDDWFLALASYNWGENAVARAVSRNRARGRPADYLNLDMPNETRHYVPKLIALKNIVKRSQELGVQLPELPNKPYFVTIEKTRPIDLKLAAQFAGMTVEEFVALNPAHNRPVIAASKNNEIKLPADRIDAFIEAVERHGEARKAFATWQPHTLTPGESLASVAERGGVTVTELQKANGLRPGAHILPGTRIIAPSRRAVDDELRVESFVAPRVYEKVEQPAVYHRVTPKDSLMSIARRYGVPAATLAAWNHLKAGVKRGTMLLVRPASSHTLLTDERGSRQIIAGSAGVQRVAAEPAYEASQAKPQPAVTAGPAPATRSPAARTGRSKAAAPAGRAHAVVRAKAAQPAARTASPSAPAAKAAAKAAQPAKAPARANAAPRKPVRIAVDHRSPRT